MSYYRKPLVGGGSRIIERAGNGRFAKLAPLDTRTCPHCECLYMQVYIDRRDVGGFVTKQWPDDCPGCGRQVTGG